MKAKNDIFWKNAKVEDIENEIVVCVSDFYNYQSVENIDSWCSGSTLIGIDQESDCEDYDNVAQVKAHAVFNYCKHCFGHFEKFEDSEKALILLKYALRLRNSNLVDLVWSFCEKEESFFNNQLKGLLLCILFAQAGDDSFYNKQQLSWIKRMEKYKNAQMHVSYDVGVKSNEASIDLLGFIYAIEQNSSLEVVLSLLEKTDTNSYCFFSEKSKKDFFKHQQVKCLIAMLNCAMDVEIAKKHIFPWFEAQVAMQGGQFLKECIFDANKVMGRNGDISFIIWTAMHSASVSKNYQWIDFFRKEVGEYGVKQGYLFLKESLIKAPSAIPSDIECLKNVGGFDFRHLYCYLTSVYEKNDLELAIVEVYEGLNSNVKKIRKSI